MSAVLLWAVGGVFVAVVAPSALAAMLRRGIDAHVGLVLWVALVVGTITSLAVPAVLSLLPRHGGVSGIAAVAHQCWAALHRNTPPRVELAIGVVGVVVIVTAAIRLAYYARFSARQRRHIHDRHLGLMRILESDGPDAADTKSTLWLPVDTPLAYAVAGTPPLIVASHGLRDRLDPAAMAAVFSHEHAHVRGRHHLLVAVAEALAYAMPWLPVMRRSPMLVRTMVEIQADNHAVDVHGRDAVRRALTGLRSHAVPAATLGVACDSVQLRLQRLSTASPPHPGALRTVRVMAAGTAAAVLPAAPVLALLAAMAFMSCALV
ncbi:M56 family metallopeptidase [Skermania sp. ID1734]|uniref:M56 family metallopeptidase n=1 Tax=Skermania sp. ID1734 TaxID=2597516 RepID=UPI00117E79C7|nr:M56 family metallopeptidase [Skermania sp. ID1734]TSD93798.1 M56 family metallopeptidase [Skermania sp. ID1734]